MGRWYTATLLSLIVHQIDAAYWHAWEMFHLPGGVQGFLLLHGYRQVTPGTPQARRHALPCGGIGVLTAPLHASFAAAG